MNLSFAAKTLSSAQTQASGSSFYSAMRLLPRSERAAMFAIYAFCRQVDDIADETGPTAEERRAQLDVWRRAIDSLYTGGPTPRVRDLAGPTRHFGLTKEDFLAVIDGMEMDVDGPIRRPDFATFDLYCDRVASAVGRLSVKVFGMADEPGRELAHHLGRALQFTNILRDLDEDAEMSRLYLPDEALAAAGIEGDEPEAVLAHPALGKACAWLAAKAHEHYGAANAVLAKKPAGRLRAPRLMSAVYRTILKRMERGGWKAPRERISLGKGALAWIVATRGLPR
ncbi:MAG TPA: presqualene diphosphate synthase HpnD [Caulobacteraceae bacterium]